MEKKLRIILIFYKYETNIYVHLKVKHKNVSVTWFTYEYHLKFDISQGYLLKALMFISKVVVIVFVAIYIYQ